MIISTCIFGQTKLPVTAHYHLNDTLYAWAVPSLSIRKSHDLNSDILGSVPFGEMVTVAEEVYISFPYDNLVEVKMVNSNEINNNKTPSFNLPGKYIKICV